MCSCSFEVVYFEFVEVNKTRLRKHEGSPMSQTIWHNASLIRMTSDDSDVFHRKFMPDERFLYLISHRYLADKELLDIVACPMLTVGKHDRPVMI